MSTETDTTDEEEYSQMALVRMGPREARELDDETYERWAQLQDLSNQMAKTDHEYEQATQNVIETAVKAERDELNHTGEWLGNEITYRLEIDDRLMGLRDSVAAEIAGPGDVDGDALEDVKDQLATLFSTLWVEFEGNVTVDMTNDIVSINGQTMPREEFCRQTIAHWGANAAFEVAVEQITEILRHKEELTDQMEKFQPTPRGSRGRNAADEQRWERRGAVQHRGDDESDAHDEGA